MRNEPTPEEWAALVAGSIDEWENPQPPVRNVKDLQARKVRDAKVATKTLEAMGTVVPAEPSTPVATPARGPHTLDKLSEPRQQLLLRLTKQLKGNPEADKVRAILNTANREGTLTGKFASDAITALTDIQKQSRTPQGDTRA